jgi:hypothetical protein
MKKVLHEESMFGSSCISTIEAIKDHRTRTCFMCLEKFKSDEVQFIRRNKFDDGVTTFKCESCLSYHTWNKLDEHKEKFWLEHRRERLEKLDENMYMDS